MTSKARISNRILGLLLRTLPKDLKRRFGVHLGALDVRWSLTQLRRFGYVPEHVLDVGASRGDWTQICLYIFPEATITCIEPQDSAQQELQKIASRNSNVKIIQSLLGSSVRGSVPFKEIGCGSSVLSGGNKKESRPMTTIDAMISDGLFAPPNLIKLDVQGYEIEVLDGWNIGFDCCEVIQIEISLIPIVQGAPLLDEVVSYLYGRGFVMFDVDELIRAPSDGAVWQIDAIFCRIDSPLRNERVWQTRLPSRKALNNSDDTNNDE